MTSALPRYRYSSSPPREIGVKLEDFLLPDHLKAPGFNPRRELVVSCDELFVGPRPGLSARRLSELAPEDLSAGTAGPEMVPARVAPLALRYELVVFREEIEPLVEEIAPPPPTASVEPAHPPVEELPGAETEPAALPPPPRPELEPEAAIPLPEPSTPQPQPASPAPEAPPPNEGSAQEPPQRRKSFFPLFRAKAQPKVAEPPTEAAAPAPPVEAAPEAALETEPPLAAEPPVARRRPVAPIVRRKRPAQELPPPPELHPQPAPEAATPEAPPAEWPATELPPRGAAGRFVETTRLTIPRRFGNRNTMPQAAPTLRHADPAPEPVPEPEPLAEPTAEAAAPAEWVAETAAPGEEQAPSSEPPPPVETSAYEQQAPAEPPAAPGEEQVVEHTPVLHVEPVGAVVRALECETSLQEIFMTEETIGLDRAVQLCGSLPGIRACILAKGSNVLAAHNAPPQLDLVSLTANAAAMIEAVRSAGLKMGLGEIPAVTIHSDSGQLSFFHAADLALLVLHADRGFIPGVRERLRDALAALGASGVRLRLGSGGDA